MRRAAKRVPGMGDWIRKAREVAGLTAAELAARTSISISTLWRLENGRAALGFAEVCRIAECTGVPLIYLATGRSRSGTEPEDLAGQVTYWGISDLAGGNLIGEAHTVESVVCDCLANPAPRILEVVPAILLFHRTSHAELLAIASLKGGEETLRRLAWVSDLAEWLVGQLPLAQLPPAAHKRIRQLRSAAARTLPKELTWDPLDKSWSAADVALAAEQQRTNLPPIHRKWRIFSLTRQERFLERTLTNLESLERARRRT